MDNHFAIPVKDLEESKLFYKKLGFEVFGQWEKPDQNLRALKMKNKSGFYVELVYHPDNRNIRLPETAAVLHIGLDVENLETKLGDLKRKGIIPITPMTKGVSIKQFAFIKDPNGFPIELVESL